jgi:hypothetical protein
MMPAAPVLGFSQRFEPHGLDIRPGDDEVAIDEAGDEGGHRCPFSRLALSPADSFCLRASLRNCMTRSAFIIRHRHAMLSLFEFKLGLPDGGGGHAVLGHL